MVKLALPAPTRTSPGIGGVFSKSTRRRTAGLNVTRLLRPGIFQGLMALDVGAQNKGPGQGIIIDYLATNPANRVTGDGLKHVGIALIAIALSRSLECGRGGRIWLESLPGAAAFYEGLGMEKQRDRSMEGNLIYTLDSAGAEQLLEEMNRQGIVEP